MFVRIASIHKAIPCASNGYGFYWPTYIGMHLLQDLCNVGTSIRWEWSTRLFALDTSFACERMYVVFVPLLHPSHLPCFKTISRYLHWDAPTSCAKTPKNVSSNHNVPKISFWLYLPYSCPIGINWTPTMQRPTSHHYLSLTTHPNELIYTFEPLKMSSFMESKFHLQVVHVKYVMHSNAPWTTFYTCFH